MKTGLGAIKSVGGARCLLGFDKRGNTVNTAAEGSLSKMDTDKVCCNLNSLLNLY